MADASTSCSVPARPGQMGEERLYSTCVQAVHLTSKSFPCISSMRGSFGDGGSSEFKSARALALSPSTFCVINVNVESGAMFWRIDRKENWARALWAALGWALRALVHHDYKYETEVDRDGCGITRDPVRTLLVDSGRTATRAMGCPRNPAAWRATLHRVSATFHLLRERSECLVMGSLGGDAS